jgi:hypothetical protein
MTMSGDEERPMSAKGAEPATGGADTPRPGTSPAAAAPAMRSRVGYYDRQGRFLYATPALAARFGMTPDQLIGRTWYEIGVPPENVSALEAIRRQVLETGTPATAKASLAIQGTHRETEFAIKPTVGPDGSIVGTVVTARDPGERRFPSRGASRLDRTYQILSAIDQVIFRTQDPTVILAEACRIAAGIGGFELAWVALLDAETLHTRLAYNSGRDEGLLPTITVTAKDDPSGYGVVGTSIRENRTVIVQDVRTDPRMAYWKGFFDQLGYRTAAAVPLRVSGKPIGALVLYSARSSRFDALEAHLFEQVAQDISNALTSIETARSIAEAQAALAQSERRYRTLFDVNPHPLAVIDVETLRFLAVNDAAVSDYGYSREEFLALTMRDVTAPEEVSAAAAAISRVLPDGSFRTSGPWRQVVKDGSTIRVEVSAHDIDFDGRAARLLLAIDVTERERLQDQLAEATRLEAMGHLAGGIAHDFNNLLTAVNGYSDILIGELGDDPRAESAREIRRAGARATELTRQVLAFARRQDSAPRPIDVNSVVGNVSQMLRRLIGEHIRLATRLSASPAVACVDPGQLEQVLVNLAVNARDAMPSGGSLEIAVEEIADGASLDRGGEGPSVLLTVADSGTGMDEATLERVFEPFFTTKPVGQGTGLGLATVYGIVRQANGQTWAESKLGKGTRICVLLPRLDATPEPLSGELRSAPASANRAVILAVEDDPSVRTFVTSTLERAGYRVLVAGTPSEAVALSDGLSDRIDLLLTDVVMPGENGHDLAERLLATRPGLRVLMMSGYDVEPIPTDERLTFLAKPFDRGLLLDAVERALAKPE